MKCRSVNRTECPDLAAAIRKASTNSASRLSVADASRAGVETAHGKGITVTVKVEDIFAAYGTIMARGFSSGRVEKHAWGADVFYLTDPDGNRIEFWAD